MNLFFKKKDKPTLDLTLSKKQIFYKYLTLFAGTFIFACAFNLFLLENDIISGGIGGIAILTKNIIEPSLLIFISSIFLLLLSWILLGKEKTEGNIFGSLLYPLFVYLTSFFIYIINIDNSELLLIVIFAGICIGFASGILFKAGFTTGGTAILSQIVAKYGKVSLGRAMLLTDGTIVLLGGFILGWTRFMYGIILLYIISFIANRVVLGISSNKAFYIISEKEDEVKNYILRTVGRGVTILEGKGGYTNDKQQIFMCLIPTKQYFKVKEGLEKIDDKAFLIVTDAYQSNRGS